MGGFCGRFSHICVCVHTRKAYIETRLAVCWQLDTAKSVLSCEICPERRFNCHFSKGDLFRSRAMAMARSARWDVPNRRATCGHTQTQSVWGCLNKRIDGVSALNVLFVSTCFDSARSLGRRLGRRPAVFRGVLRSVAVLLEGCPSLPTVGGRKNLYYCNEKEKDKEANSSLENRFWSTMCLRESQMYVPRSVLAHNGRWKVFVFPTEEEAKVEVENPFLHTCCLCDQVEHLVGRTINRKGLTGLRVLL